MKDISLTVNRKFTTIIDVSDYEIETDTGWVDLTHICETIPYDVWEIETEDSSILRCADDHILFDENLNQKFTKDFLPGNLVFTRTGPKPVKRVERVAPPEKMFDLRVNHPNHRFWSGDFLSHNTTIINALCYAFYNKPFDNISLQRLINSTNDSKNTLMEVRVTFTKGNDEYEIYRCRGENYTIQVLMNGDDITLDSVAENDKLVEEIIGISYELFTKIIIFSGNSTPFLQMPVSQQRQQIEELFNITLLTEKALKLKDIIKQTENDINVQEAIVREQEAAVNLYNKQLVEAEQRVKKWEESRAITIQKLTEQLDILQNVDMDAEHELHLAYAALEKNLKDITAAITVISRDERELVSSTKKLDDELKHLLNDKCPYCLQSYAGAADKLIEKQQQLENLHKKLEDVKRTLDEKNDKKKQLVQEIELIKSELKFKTLTEALEMRATALTAQQKIDELNNSTNPHIEAFEELKKHAVKKVTYEKLDELRKELEHQNFLLRLLTDKNSFIRRRIINRTIPFLNNRLIYYTKQLGLPHVVKFDDDMSCTVSECGRELDFGNLSSGEKKRVNLSLSLAFRDVLHHLHARINCLFIDEIDASLDATGVESVFRLLKQKTRDEGLGLWIISHRPEAVGRFDRTVTVRKENGFSRIIQEGDEEENAA